MEKVKIYLDEDVIPLLAKVLKNRGYDVISCIERKNFGLTDEEQLNIATRDKRAIMTHNIKDFVKLHKKLNGEHSGIILSDQIPFSLLLQRMLRLLVRTNREDIERKIIWLSNYR